MAIVTDVAVVGLGGMGAMALWRCAARGAGATGFDSYAPPHDRGSSHGESRIIRTAYAEGAFYVPLLREAWALWRRLEAETGASLLVPTGALMVGLRDGALVAGALESARRHGLEHELLGGAEATRRWPQHRLDPDDTVLWEPAAGALRPEAAVAAALGRAVELGASAHLETSVAGIDASARGVRLALAGGEDVVARRCIVAAGAWTGTLLPELAASLTVERQVMGWFPVDDPTAFAPERFPVFIRELRGGRLRYGLPSLDGATIKVAVHHEGRPVLPQSLDRTISSGDLEPLARFVGSRLRGVAPEAVRASACMYTNTPDEHLLVGALPGRREVVVLGGCSGHSFKLAPVLADAAVDLALAGATAHEVGTLDPVRLLGAAGRP